MKNILDEKILNNKEFIEKIKYDDNGIVVEPIELVNHLKEKEVIFLKLQEAQSLLDSTEFKFNDDYDLKYTTEWEELRAKRQEAREFIRANK